MNNRASSSSIGERVVLKSTGAAVKPWMKDEKRTGLASSNSVIKPSSATAPAWKAKNVGPTSPTNSKPATPIGVKKDFKGLSKSPAPLSPSKKPVTSRTGGSTTSAKKSVATFEAKKHFQGLSKSPEPISPSKKLVSSRPKISSPISPSKKNEASWTTPASPKVPWKKNTSPTRKKKSLAASLGSMYTVPAKKPSKGLTQQVLKAEAQDVVVKKAAVDMLVDNSLSKNVEALVDRIREAGGYPQRRRLSLRDNDLVTTMERVILNDPTVTCIEIDSDPRFAHIQKCLIVEFAESIRTNLHLKTLSIQGVELDNNFLSALSTSIESNFTLESIILCNNAFTSDALVEFCQAMGENESVQTVDLRNQLSPILTTGEDMVLESLTNNQCVKTFQVDCKSKSVESAVDKIAARNKESPFKFDKDKKLLGLLEEEASRAEELMKHRQLAAKTLNVSSEDDWKYLYELSQRANTYNLATLIIEEVTGDARRDGASSEFQTCRQSAQKMLGAVVNFTNDGSFLTDEFISTYLVEDVACGSLSFAFQSQCKLFKRFPIGDTKRKFISETFADALLKHPRAGEVTHINMANCGCGDEWLVRLCEKVLDDPTLLPNLHLLNMETNFVSTPGVLALSKCLASPNAWIYLQAVKLENQRNLISSRAELELAKSLCMNRSVIRFSLRVRNLWERDQVNKFVSRNMDFLRQARLSHAIETGTHVQRARNAIEKLFDQVAASDPALSEVDLVGNQLFLSLPREEKVKAARSFGTNTHVKSVRMTMLRLDDEFACTLTQAIASNSTIEKLILDSNMIGSEGILALVGSLATNKSIVELQLRHQSKPLGSNEEDKLPGYLQTNDTICKLGVDIRGMLPQTELERKLASNRELARVARQKDGGGPPPSAVAIKLPKGKMQQFFAKIAENDSSTGTTVDLVGDKLFLTMKDADRLQAARTLVDNTHIKSVRMTMLQLDDKFACTLADSIRCNSTIEKIILDSNMIGSEGIKALIGALAHNKSITEFQCRHQSKPMATVDEELLVGLLGGNETLLKLGVDLRSHRARRDLDNKMAKNRDLNRNVRRSRSFGN